MNFKLGCLPIIKYIHFISISHGLSHSRFQTSIAFFSKLFFLVFLEIGLYNSRTTICFDCNDWIISGAIVTAIIAFKFWLNFNSIELFFCYKYKTLRMAYTYKEHYPKLNHRFCWNSIHLKYYKNDWKWREN